MYKGFSFLLTEFHPFFPGVFLSFTIVLNPAGVDHMTFYKIFIANFLLYFLASYIPTEE